MEYKLPVESYKGAVKEVIIGQGERQVRLGGENTLPYHIFEGQIKNKPALALEVYDMPPEGWTEGIVELYKDVLSTPEMWAKKCQDEYLCDAICLQLLSTDPTEKNTSPQEAAQVVSKVLSEIKVPLIVWGCGNAEKDAEVLCEVARKLSGKNLLLGPVVKENYEVIAPVARDNGHCLVAQAPMDVNLTKELLVKLSKIFPSDKIVIDPLTPPLGFGLDYGFTICERIKQAGVKFGDEIMQQPLIANIPRDVWKTKESKQSKAQGILWEAITALSYLLAGANIVILRHPESLKMLRITGCGL